MSSRSEWVRKAKAVSPEEWAARVGALADGAVRRKVAAIVWWDHVSGAVGASKALYALMRGPADEVGDAAAAAGLVAVGYPPDVAAGRVDSRGRQVFVTDDETNANDLRYAVGEHSLMCAVCQQSFNDAKTLVERGVVLPDGGIRADWPPKNHNGVVDYRGRSEVAELLDWVLGGGLKHELGEVGLGRDFGEVLWMMGLKGCPGARKPKEVA